MMILLTAASILAFVSACGVSYEIIRTIKRDVARCPTLREKIREVLLTSLALLLTFSTATTASYTFATVWF